RERWFTRAACAELLIEAGAVVTPSVCEGLIESRAKGLLHLFQRKGLLPRTPRFFAALGDIDGLRTTLDESRSDRALINEAFTIACRFGHQAMAAFLLDRSVALDAELGAHVDGDLGRPAFITYFIENRPTHVAKVGPWKAFVMEHVRRAVCSWSGHRTSVTS